jgi:hypothetical protein
MKTWEVTVIKPSTGERVTVVVEAGTEARAKTFAMMTPEVRQAIRFRGEQAEYEVKEVQS